MGVAGAVTDSRFVLLAGVAGLLAGAFSDAAGGHVSMSAQRDKLFENQILPLSDATLADKPQGEQKSLASTPMQAKVCRMMRRRSWRHIMADPAVALGRLTPSR